MKALSFILSKKASGLGLVIAFLFAVLAFNPMQAQEQAQKTIKGVISNDTGPLESVSIILKDTKVGTVTNENGEFTFPKPLSVGDILVISYIGYKNLEYKIKENTSFVEIVLSEELVEFVGALNSDKPYKSKRSKKRKKQ